MTRILPKCDIFLTNENTHLCSVKRVNLSGDEEESLCYDDSSTSKLPMVRGV